MVISIILRRKWLAHLLILCCPMFGMVSVKAQSSDVATAANNQGLTLFEGVETVTTANGNPSRPNRGARATTAEPEFTLIGTSRIGSNYSAMVKHKDGETLLVNAGTNENTPIADHAGYSIVNIEAGSVSISYPSNNPCMEFSGRGVRCNAAGNIAELVLANGEPLPPAISISTFEDDASSRDGTQEVVESLDTNPANPFEALRNAQNARGSVAQDGNVAGGTFTPRRLNPEDIPEGKRIITTPFGDRLVDQ